MPPRPRAHAAARRRQVTLPDGRVVTGDFQCLDKQGNLILGNAHELIHHHSSSASGGDAAASASSSSGRGSGSGGSGGGGPAPNGGAAGGAPMEKALGCVLVPRAQQADVRVLVTLSERAAMLQLAGGG